MTLVSTLPAVRANGQETVFAAVELNLRNKGDQEYLVDALASSKSDANLAWAHYERLGVVRYPLNRAARIAGAVRLYAAEIDQQGRLIGPLGESGDINLDAIAIVKGIYSRTGGLRGLTERFFLQQKVPADSHLIRVKEGGVYDGYMFLSPEELSTSADGIPIEVNSASGVDLTWTTRPGGSARPARTKKVARKDYLGRVWTPSPRFLDMTDSPLKVLDGDCDLLHRMHVVMRAQMRSRAALSGFLFLPSTLTNAAAGEKDATGTQSLVKLINEVISNNLQLSEAGDAADIAHIILAGHPEAGKQIAEITLGGETKETDLLLRKELFERIMFALDINTRASSGSSDTRFQSWNDSSEELRLAVIPDIEAMCWAFTRMILRRQLIELGYPADRINRLVVAYDLSEASVKINREDSANQLSDRGALANRTNRRVAGFTDDDKPSDDEYIQQFGWRAKNPYLAFWGLPLPDDFDWDKAMQKPEGKPADSSADDPAPGPGQGDPGSPGDTDTDDKPENS